MDEQLKPQRISKGRIISVIGALVILALENIAIRNTKADFWTGFLPIALLGAIAIAYWIELTFRWFVKKEGAVNE